MSSAAGSRLKEKKTGLSSPGKDKGKGKNTQPAREETTDEEEEEEEEEEYDDSDEEMGEDEDEDEDDKSPAIDPSAIIGGRRTRGIKVDYTSKEALEKAGLKPEDEDEDEEMRQSND